MTRVVFLHGLESSPQGSKVQHLKSRADLEVSAPAFDTEALRRFLAEHASPKGLPPELIEPLVKVAVDAVEDARPDVLVGSSMGGAIAMELSRRGAYAGPMVLLAPAGTKLLGIERLAHPARVAVVHGTEDDVVPVEHSEALVKQSSGEVSLARVKDGHRLSAAVAGGALDQAIAWALGHTDALERKADDPAG